MTALAHPQENNKAATATRTRTISLAEPATQQRKSKNEPDKQESSLFDALLLTPPCELPPPVMMQWESASPHTPLHTQSADAPASPARAWQQIEPALCNVTEQQPSGPVSMTLLLPQLGEVDARLSPIPAGWDISLRFDPQAMAMIAPHQQRCQESLRRRMACAVRLRFEQRGGRK